MFGFSFLFSSPFFLFATVLSWAAPTISTGRSSLVRRTLYCSNAPSVVAGTKLPTNLQPPIWPLPYIFNIVWCTPDTETYLIVNPGSPIASDIIKNILQGASKAVSDRTAAQGDGMLQYGQFSWSDSQVVLRVQNANNHQVMYGVLASALTGMQMYMWNLGYGGVQFRLYDGKNQVGQGSIGFA